MTAFFVDTSALAKRYVPEAGSAWVRSWIDPSQGNVILISEVTIVELVSALARRQREGTVSSTDFLRLRNDFLLHADREYLVVNLHDRVVLQASRLVAAHPLRTLDALQLASALVAARDLGAIPTFVSADRNLLAVAAAHGLPTDDPHAHP